MVHPLYNPPPAHNRRELVAWLILVGVALSVVGYLYFSHPDTTDSKRHGMGKTGQSSANKTGPASADDAPVAMVNGDAVTVADLEDALKLRPGQDLLEKLVEQKLILQEARRCQVALDDPISVSRMADFRKTRPAGVTEDSLRARLLLRKLVLKSVTPAQIQHVYDVFKEDLTQYEVFRILVAESPEAHTIYTNTRKGQDFGHIAQRQSLDLGTKDAGGRMGFLTLAQVQDSMGSDVAAEVYRLRDSGVAPPIKTPQGYYVVKVGWVHSSFTDLKASVEDVLVRAGSDALLYRLRKQWPVVSSLLDTDKNGTAGTDADRSVFDIPSAVPMSSTFSQPNAPPRRRQDP